MIVRSADIMSIIFDLWEMRVDGSLSQDQFCKIAHKLNELTSWDVCDKIVALLIAASED